MRILAIQTSPNTDGLTARLAEAALAGARLSGVEVELVNLNKLELEHCRACGTGWGHHFEPGKLQAGECIIKDDFAGLHEKVLAADGLVFATPVYFGDMSESARVFVDRLRRCEWPQRQNSPLRGKHLLTIAAAGGSGGGAPGAAARVEEILIGTLGMVRVGALAVTRFNADIELHAAHEFGRLMVEMVEGSR
jgi:multimeric flavodoxin WrbA